MQVLIIAKKVNPVKEKFKKINSENLSRNRKSPF